MLVYNHRQNLGGGLELGRNKAKQENFNVYNAGQSIWEKIKKSRKIEQD